MNKLYMREHSLPVPIYGGLGYNMMKIFIISIIIGLLENEQIFVIIIKTITKLTMYVTCIILTGFDNKLVCNTVIDLYQKELSLLLLKIKVQVTRVHLNRNSRR